MNSDFKFVGDCAGRPSGIKRVVMDAICRLTGHLLWRNHTNAGYLPAGHSLDHYTCHCRRCWIWGYVESDFKR